jgi:hypothetical protein
MRVARGSGPEAAGDVGENGAGARGVDRGTGPGKVARVSMTPWIASIQFSSSSLEGATNASPSALSAVATLNTKGDLDRGWVMWDTVAPSRSKMPLGLPSYPWGDS